MVVIDDSRAMLQIVASLTDDFGGIICDCNMFIVHGKRVSAWHESNPFYSWKLGPGLILFLHHFLSPGASDRWQDSNCQSHDYEPSVLPPCHICYLNFVHECVNFWQSYKKRLFIVQVKSRCVAWIQPLLNLKTRPRFFLVFSPFCLSRGQGQWQDSNSQSHDYYINFVHECVNFRQSKKAFIRRHLMRDEKIF